MTQRTLDPSAEQISVLASATGTGPIVMLNLLRFKDRADGIDAADGISGREAYERYGAGVGPHLAAAGGEILFMAECAAGVIGPEDEDWDVMVLVRYPSRQAFLGMIADPGYQAVHRHRAAALEDSRLVCCEPTVTAQP